MFVHCARLDSERTFTYNECMKADKGDERLRLRVREIAGFYRKRGRMPSFSEIGELTGLRSKNAVFKLIGRLEKLRVLKRDARGRLTPLSIASPVKVLGRVEAGYPSPAEEELADTLSLDDYLVKNPEATYMLKVTGDSMSGAGVLPGDMVLVDKGRTPKNGDIVIAQAQKGTQGRRSRDGGSQKIPLTGPSGTPWTTSL
jgi:repressor LexA